MSERQAILNELLDTSFLYRANAALKHGVAPRPEPNRVSQTMSDRCTDNQTDQAGPTDPAAATASEPVAAETRQPTRASTWRRWAATAATAAAAGGGGWWLARDVPPADQTVPRPPAVVLPDRAPGGGDLLEWLRREGYDRPPATPGKGREVEHGPNEPDATAR
ncbi:MAG TPA: hypothetical protein ENK13_04820 [Thermopetrobacter sp.]|nr:hypothetical protein [Thermopetrobacter sp.]